MGKISSSQGFLLLPTEFRDQTQQCWLDDPDPLCHRPGGLVCVGPTSNQFSRCFQFSILLPVTRGRMSRAGGEGCGRPGQESRGGGRCWVRIWWLYCSHCHHHIITATDRSKLPPPALKIKLSVIIWFWFLWWRPRLTTVVSIHNIDAADFWLGMAGGLR